MICSVCNKEVDEGTVVCPFCGADLSKKEARVIEIAFKKPTPPPTIVVSFIEPEPEYVEPEPEYVEPEPMPEPTPEPKPILKKTRKKVKKQKPVQEPVQEKPKSKDKINFLFLILSLLWAPYPGIALWVATSKKTPKASQTYGICAIVMYLLSRVRIYVGAFFRALAVGLLLLVCAVVSVVFIMIQYNITFPAVPMV